MSGSLIEIDDNSLSLGYNEYPANKPFLNSNWRAKKHPGVKGISKNENVCKAFPETERDLIFELLNELKVKINNSAPFDLKNSSEPSAAVVAAARSIEEAPRFNNSQPIHHINDQNHIHNNHNNYNRSHNDNSNDQQEPTNLKNKSKRSHRNRKGEERREKEISSNHDLDDDVYLKNLSNNSRQHRSKPLNENENSDTKKVGRKISKFTQTRITGLEGQLQRIEDMLKQDLSNTSLSYERSGGGADREINGIKRDHYRDDSRRMMMVGGAHQDEGNNYNMTNVERMRGNMNDEDFLEDETEYKDFKIQETPKYRNNKRRVNKSNKSLDRVCSNSRKLNKSKSVDALNSRQQQANHNHHHQQQQQTRFSQPNRHFRLNLFEIPFVVGKSISESHNVGMKIQSLISQLKNHNPILCRN